ncbi:hypothetical protein G4B88_005489 [Cannabis sativa]|nr:hypothetical protein G4B88_005489 [Cannabis sativa]
MGSHNKENGTDIIDLENGGEAMTSTSEEQKHDHNYNHDRDSDSDCKNQKKMLSKLRSGNLGKFRTIGRRGSADGLLLLGTSKNNVCLSSIGGDNDDDLDILVNGVEGKVGGGDNFVDKKKVNKKYSSKKKYPKPPRPPGGPSLDEADLKLVKEIWEHSRARRNSREKTKALKKLKANKTPSSNVNVLAMIITITFFLVIIFQVLVLHNPLHVIKKEFHTNKNKHTLEKRGGDV